MVLFFENATITCPSGSYRHFKERGEPCTPCGTFPIFRILLSISVIALGCVFFAVMSVKSGVHRSSTHSIVLKLLLGYYVAFLTFKDHLTILIPGEGSNDLLHRADGSTSSSIIRTLVSLDWQPYQCLFDEYADISQLAMLSVIPTVSILIICTIQTIVSIGCVIIGRLRFTAALQHRAKIAELISKYNCQNVSEKILVSISEYRFLTLFSISEKKRKFRIFTRDMIPIYLVTCTTMYNDVLSKAAKLYGCERQISGVLMHKYLTDFECNLQNPDYLKLMYIAVVLIATWVIVFPFICFKALYSKRSNLQDFANRQMLGFLTNGYDSRFWYWEIITFIRKAACICLPQLYYPNAGELKTPDIPLLLAVGFFIIYCHTDPYDKRSGGLLGRTERTMIFTWVFSCIVLGININARSSLPIAPVLVAAANSIVVGYSCSVLVREFWAGTIKGHNLLAKMMQRTQAFYRRVISKFISRKSCVVTLQCHRDEMSLTRIKSSQDHDGNLPKGSESRPRIREQKHLVDTYYHALNYFLRKSPKDGIGIDMCFYIARNGLVTRSMVLMKEVRLTDLYRFKLSDIELDLKKYAAAGKPLEEYEKDRSPIGIISGIDEKASIRNLLTSKALRWPMSLSFFHNVMYDIDQLSIENHSKSFSTYKKIRQRYFESIEVPVRQQIELLTTLQNEINQHLKSKTNLDLSANGLRQSDQRVEELEKKYDTVISNLEMSSSNGEYIRQIVPLMNTDVLEPDSSWIRG